LSRTHLTAAEVPLAKESGALSAVEKAFSAGLRSLPLFSIGISYSEEISMLTKPLSRQALLSGTCAVIFTLQPLLAHAQQASAPSPRAPQAVAQQNSENCGFSFFTEGDDRLDFRHAVENPCFDMMGGDDMLILNRKDFGEGVRVFTGAGRDTSWLTDGDDKITDINGEDRDIRTFDGNDHIVFELGADRDAFRGVETFQVTDVAPGRGKNLIRIGENIATNAVARVSPNLRLWPEAGGENDVNITCGRPWISDVTDLLVAAGPQGSHVDVSSDGCGLAFEAQHGRVKLEQIGGRLAINTDPEGNRFEEQHGELYLTGTVKAGTGMFLEITRSDPRTDFDWEGTGVAMLSLDLEDAAYGGTFSVASTGQVVYERSGPGSVAADLISEAGVMVRYRSSDQAPKDFLRLAGPAAKVNWQWGSGLSFPQITNQVSLTQEWVSFEIPNNPFLAEADEVIRTDDYNVSGTIDVLPQIIPPEKVEATRGLPEKLVEEMRTATLGPAKAALEMDFRAARDEGCVQIKLTGPTLSETHSCGEGEVDVEGAADIRSISITLKGKTMLVDVNGTANFHISDLSFRL
jgi:hypothetical protein